MQTNGQKKLLTVVAIVLAGVWFCSRVAPAVAAVPDIETFENDPNPYTPTADPIHDPNLSGSPPPGWHDQRNGWSGLIQSVPSGFLGIPTSPSGGSNYGIIYPADAQAPPVYTNAPYGAPAASIAPLATSWSFQTDIYTDGSILANNNGIPDFWWTNAVNNNSGTGIQTISSNSYLTETGFTGQVLPSGQWRFTTTKGGQPSVDLASNSWYTLEVSYDTSQTQLAGTLKIYNQAHTALLYSDTLSTMFPEDTPPQSSQLGGPLYSWFTYFNNNMTHLAVDNVGVGAPISLVTSNVPGDMNGDGIVNAADVGQFTSSLSNFSATQNQIGMGDVNGDGKFNYFDITAFQNLESSVGGGSVSFAVAVPEPSTFALLGISGLFGLVAFGRRSRSRRSMASGS